jgi:hypothetical protein
VVITVGKHAASEGSPVHPLVAGALARRAADGADGHGGQSAPERTDRVGWPAPPAPDGGGLGWPGRDPAEAQAPHVTEARAVAQRGWRRLFRQRPAA